MDKGPSINDVSSEGEEGGTPQTPMKGDENRYLFLGKADIVYDLPKILRGDENMYLIWPKPT